MGTRNGHGQKQLLIVKLSKIQVTMIMTRSLDGISAHCWTCNLIPANCVTTVNVVSRLYSFTLYWKNNVKEFVEIQSAHYMVYSITCMNHFHVINIFFKLFSLCR
jgi:hypothetical protein